MDTALAQLLAASLAFVGTHFALSHPLRGVVENPLGPRGFQAIYSLVALATLGWMIVAFRAVTDGAPLWDGTGSGHWGLASVLTLIAAVLLLGSFQGNPALPDPRARDLAAKGPHGVFYVTRHPMMWAMALWSLAHAAVAPTPRVLVLSGAVALLALVGAHLQDRKKAVQLGSAWTRWEAQTSYWPRLERLGKAGPIPLGGGVALWLVATWAHIPAIYVPAGAWRWLVG